MATTTNRESGNGIGTSPVSIHTTDTDPYVELPDVSFRNIVVMLTIVVLMLAKKLRLSVGAIEEKLFSGLPREWTRERVLKEPMPLYVYNIVERNLARLLGDPAALLPAALYGSVRAGFGETTLWVFNLLRGFTHFVAPFIASPGFYFQYILPAVSRLYNRNKDTIPVEVTWKQARMRYVRSAYAGKKLRATRGDIFSMLWWAPGFSAGPVSFWGIVARVRHLIVELDPVEVFTACAEFISGSAQLQVDGDALKFRGQSIGHTIRLFREPRKDELGNGAYYTQIQAQGDALDFVWGWQIDRDVAVLARDGHPWTIMRQGEIYSAAAGCTLTVYEYEPADRLSYYVRAFQAQTLPWLFKPLLWVAIRGVGWAVHHLDRRAVEAWQRGEYEEKELILERFGREHFPSQEELFAAVRGEIEEIAVDAVVVRLDFEGHTARRKKIGAAKLRQIERPFWYSIFDFDINPTVQHGRLPRQLLPGVPVVRFAGFLGDGAYVLFYNASLQELVEQAMRFASYLHDSAAEVWRGSDWPALPLRVSITYGGVVLAAYGRRLNPDNPMDQRRALMRLFPEGDALDEGSRLDEVAKKLRALAVKHEQEANRFTLIGHALFKQAGLTIRHEDLGNHDVRDVGKTRLIRVLDDKAKPVSWPRQIG